MLHRYQRKIFKLCRTKRIVKSCRPFNTKHTTFQNSQVHFLTLGGFEFGMTSPSYIAFKTDAKKIGQKSKYEFRFRTSEPNAVLMASAGGPRDYEHVYLQDGKVRMKVESKTVFDNA